MYVIENNQRRELKERDLYYNGYFLGGYHDNYEAGKLFFLHRDNDKTVLGPVFDESGVNPVHPEFAGKDVKETTYLNYKP